MVDVLKAEPGQDIRGQRFEQTALPKNFQGAIAGQKPLHKVIALGGLGMGCLVTSALLGVLGAALGLEVQSQGQFGNTFYESLTTALILLLWLWAVTYQPWERALGVGLAGLSSSLLLQTLLGQLGAIDLVENYFLSTTLTVLICWTMCAVVFMFTRSALAAVDILCLRAARVKWLGLVLVMVGAIAGAALGSDPNPYQELGIPAATDAQARLAQGVGITFAVAVALLAWVANRRRRTPWHHPDQVRNWALAWGCLGGTSFHQLDLNQVNFAGATLANTDLRGRSLYRTCFRHAQRLERARTDNRYLDLDHPKVQTLITQGTSADKDFRGFNLQGINLRHTAELPPADLQDMDFTGANLTGADLRGANLTGSNLAQAQLVNADLSGATLTDICIEDWHISPRTRFQGVTCQRVFLRRSPKGHFLDPQPERSEFQPGEFEAWIATIQRSISLSFQEAVNPQALAFALTQTALNYQAPDLFAVQKR